MIEAMDSRKALASDIKNAISLLSACAPLAFAPLQGDPQPCTRGVLAILAARLLRSQKFDMRTFAATQHLLSDVQKQLQAAEKAANLSEAAGMTENHLSACALVANSR